VQRPKKKDEQSTTPKVQKQGSDDQRAGPSVTNGRDKALEPKKKAEKKSEPKQKEKKNWSSSQDKVFGPPLSRAAMLILFKNSSIVYVIT